MKTSEEELMRRFWENVIKTDSGCWIWTGGHTKEGYGRFWNGMRKVLPNRFLYERVIGQIPEGLLLCHSCDNPPCVNPDHQFPGTYQDNQLDAVSKGRRKSRTARRRLSKVVIAIIRKSYDGTLDSQTMLCKRFGLLPSQVERIVRGETKLKHVLKLPVKTLDICK